MAIAEAVAKRVLGGERLSREEGVALLRDGDLLELGMLADFVRRRRHPEGIVTYIIDRNINYTNVCTAQCAFCAFYRDLPSKEGYLLSKEQLAQKIEETLALGGNQILLQGGLHPDLGIEFYEELFRWMKSTYPIWIHGLSPAEIKHIDRVSNLTTEQTLRRLIAAGLDSIPGGGAEVLSDRVRQIIGIAKGSTADWLDVMETAHRLGLRTTATMMFGHVETLEERIDHLLHRRRPLPPHRSRDRAQHPGRRLRPQAADDALRDRGRSLLLDARRPAHAGRESARDLAGQLRAQWTAGLSHASGPKPCGGSIRGRASSSCRTSGTSSPPASSKRLASPLSPPPARASRSRSATRTASASAGRRWRRPSGGSRPVSGCRSRPTWKPVTAARRRPQRRRRGR